MNIVNIIPSRRITCEFISYSVIQGDSSSDCAILPSVMRVYCDNKALLEKIGSLLKSEDLVISSTGVKKGHAFGDKEYTTKSKYLFFDATIAPSGAFLNKFAFFICNYNALYKDSMLTLSISKRVLDEATFAFSTPNVMTSLSVNDKVRKVLVYTYYTFAINFLRAYEKALKEANADVLPTYEFFTCSLSSVLDGRYSKFGSINNGIISVTGVFNYE